MNVISSKYITRCFLRLDQPTEYELHICVQQRFRSWIFNLSFYPCSLRALSFSPLFYYGEINSRSTSPTINPVAGIARSRFRRQLMWICHERTQFHRIYCLLLVRFTNCVALHSLKICRYDPFISNRVTDILEKGSAIQWCHLVTLHFVLEILIWRKGKPVPIYIQVGYVDSFHWHIRHYLSRLSDSTCLASRGH